MSRYLTDLWCFSEWLAAHAPHVVAPALRSRAVLEDYLLWVRQESGWKPATCSHRVVALRSLLEEQAEDGLSGMPRGAVIHRAEIPRVDYRLPKQLGGEIFDQWVDPANLALLDDEQHRTVVLLLAFTGLRVSSVVTLARDARELGPDGQAYLRYSFNIKAKREAMLAIAPALSEQLERQEALLAERYPEGAGWLLPSPPIRPAERQGRRLSHVPSHGQPDRQELRRGCGHQHRRRRARTGRASASVSPSRGDEHGQREDSADADSEGAGSRLDRDDRALCAAAR